MTFPQLSLFFFAADSAAVEQHKYALFLEAARFADANGFTAVWTPERHFQQFGGLYGNPSVTSAALAVLTTRIQIRAGSVVLPLNNALRVAEEWSMIDNLSNGRVAVAFASGWHVDDFVLAPETYAQRYQDMYEKIDVIQRLWKGEVIRLPNGMGAETDVRILPRPVQPELPIWLTAKSEDTFRRAGELGFNILTANFAIKTVKELSRRISVYREGITRCHGRPGHVTLMAHTFVAENEGVGTDLADAAMRNYLAQNIHMKEANDKGSSQPRGFLSLSERDQRSIVDMQTWMNLAGPLSFVGSLERCAMQAESFAALGVDEIACLIDFGIHKSDVIASLGRLTSLIA